MLVGKILSICGSMQFFSQMESLQEELRSRGYRIYLPEPEESENHYAGLPLKEKPGQKRKFIDSHLEKIKNSNAVLIANYPKHHIDGYIGPNTLMEIAFAYALQKEIILLYPMAEQSCRDEVCGLQPRILNGDLELI